MRYLIGIVTLVAFFALAQAVHIQKLKREAVTTQLIIGTL